MIPHYTRKKENLIATISHRIEKVSLLPYRFKCIILAIGKDGIRMAMEMYVVRHGQTLWNQQRRLQGIKDSPLTSEGLKQAGSLAERLSEVPFGTIYASDLGRAMVTARIISARLNGLQIKPDVRLRERNFGIFHGYNWEEIQKRFPEEGALEKNGNGEYIIPEGESRKQLTERVVSFLEEMSRIHQEGKILAVTHGGILSAMIRHMLHISTEQPRRFYLPNAALNIFEYNGETWYVKTIGEVFFHTEEDLGDGVQ